MSQIGLTRDCCLIRRIDTIRHIPRIRQTFLLFAFALLLLIAALLLTFLRLSWIEGAEQRLIETRMRHATEMTLYIPAAQESHTRVITSSAALSRVSSLMRLANGRQINGKLRNASGGCSIEVRFDERVAVAINASLSGVITRRTSLSGECVAFIWDFDESRLRLLANEAGFAWPLLSDIIAIEDE